MIQKWKYVSVSDCVKIIIFSVIMLLIAFIPFSFSSDTTSQVLSLKILPIIGSEQEILESSREIIINGISATISTIPSSTLDLLNTFFSLSFDLFFGIVLFDLVASIILAITRVNVLRKILRVISIICGFAMIFINICCILYVLGIVCTVIQNFEELNTVVLSNGTLFFIVMQVFSLILAVKQFKWFSKPY